jgi:predicted transcriptional regulator
MDICRSRLDVYKELLAQVRMGNCQPAELVCSVNISRDSFNLYRDSLVSLGLLRVVDEGLGGGVQVTGRGEMVVGYLEFSGSLGVTCRLGVSSAQPSQLRVE